jgi:phosphoglycerate dehydrogenase-like enzyme
MSKPKVILDPHGRRMEWIFKPEDYARLESMAEVIWARNEPMPIEEFRRHSRDVSVVATTRWRFGSIADMTQLQAIFEVGGSPIPRDLLDYQACFARGIRVMSCSPLFGPAVAEMALGMALCSARGILKADAKMRSGQWKSSREGNADNFTLYKKRVGFVGFGGLAQSLKPLLDPFQPEYLVHDPWLPPAYLARFRVKPVDLDTLLAESRLIFVLAVPSSENKGLIDRRRLGLIRPDAVFLLMSRAHLVDFDALVEMVNAGRFQAAIDVYPTEPLPADHPVRGSANTILSAHIAGNIPEDFLNMGTMLVNDIEAILAGIPPREFKSADPELVRRQ